VLSNQIDHHIHTLGESLENIEIGLLEEPYEDSLELLCPKTAQKPISEDACKNVRILDFLLDIQKDCGIDVPINAETRLNLAKFYYKKQKFDKALENITKLDGHPSAEASLYKGVILKKMGKEKQSRKAFEEAVKNFESAACWLCMLKVDSKNKDEIQDFINTTKDCPKSSLTKHCINKLSTAYYKKAKLFASDKASMASDMNKALDIVNTVINNFESWAAYYNKACDLSVMAKLDLKILGKECDYNKDQMKDEIISCLKKAFDEKPALAVHSNTDVDLEWIKEKYPDEFYALLGKVYDKNHRILYTEG
jgi:tetratricopeptide (TPR) repeat protein